MDTTNLSISELKALLNGLSQRRQSLLIKTLEKDPRKGVRELARKARNKIDWRRRELARLRRLMKYEAKLREDGYELVAGADEAGRGALAGPLVAGAVILKGKERILGINDSKKLRPAHREELALTIKEQAVAWSVFEIDWLEIDRIGLQAANLGALAEAVGRLNPAPDFLICDGFNLSIPKIPSMKLVKGDSLSQSVAAASILAKVHRDGLMRSYHGSDPAYGFDANMGYATDAHIRAIKKLGPCPLHRNSFFPVSEILSGQTQLELER